MIPAVPRTTNLDAYVWGTPLFPKETGAAYVVYLPHPTDPAQFEVFGIDAKRGQFAFHGEGHTRTAYAPTQEQINRDVVAAGLTSGLTTLLRGHGGGQIDTGPVGPPPPIPPINERAKWAWQVASDIWRIDSAYPAATSETTPPVVR